MLPISFQTFLNFAPENRQKEQICKFLNEHPEDINNIYDALSSISPQSTTTTSLAEREISVVVDAQLSKKIISYIDDIHNEQKQKFFNEIEHNELKQIRNLVSNGLNPNVLDKDGNSPLTLALRLNHQEIATYLADLTKDIRATDPTTQDSYLHLAVQHLPNDEQGAEVIKKLLDSGVDAGWQNDEGLTPLMLASKEGYDAHVKQLVQHETLEIRDSNGRTALMLACESGHMDIVNSLIQMGASVNTRDETGRTPLMIACQKGKLEIAVLLTDAGASVIQEDEHGHTPLMIAANAFYASVVNHLIDQGAADYLKENQANAILQRMCAVGDTASVEKLVLKGYAFDRQDMEGSRPLLEACQHGCRATALYLLQNGAELDLPDNHGQTAVMKAVMCGSLETLEMLMVGDPDVNVADSKGYTALHYCFMRTFESSSMLRVLIGKGADYNKFLNSLHLDEEVKNRIFEAYQSGTIYGDVEAIKMLNETFYHQVRDNLKHFLAKPVSKNTKIECDVLLKTHPVVKDLSVFEFTNMNAYNKIQRERMAGSSTLSDSTKAKESLNKKKAKWLEADKLVRKWALSRMPLNKEKIAEINGLLVSKGGGQYRIRDEEVSSGGSVVLTYLRGEYVDEEMRQFIEWLNEQISACDNEVLNPVELAARAAQYFVSIHPFNDGNGRTCRLIMDYILQRYELPVYMDDVMIPAVFTFSGHNVEPEKVVKQVIKGVEHSYAALNITIGNRHEQSTMSR